MRMTSTWRTNTQALVAVAAVASGCKARSGHPAHDNAPSTLRDSSSVSAIEQAAPAAAAPAPVVADDKDRAPQRHRSAAVPPKALAAATEAAGFGAGAGAGRAKPPEAATRAWFPETFLFEPLVVTDDRGAAVVPVRVPDRLTTWRVLALAHSRSGAQGGAVTSFLGTLPTYVDPVVPAFLIKGDEVRLPIQIVNTTAKDVAGTLEIAALNATLANAAGGARTIPAQGSTVDTATLVADRAGPVKLRVALAGNDAVERVFEVRPSGRLVTQTRSGTLAAPRSFTTAGMPGADASTDRARLRVFPGALGLLRSELGVSSARAGVADDAYALLLAGKAAGLLAALGDKPDPVVLRELAIVTAQRAIRAGRTLDVERATLLAEPALAHPDNPVLARLGERAAAYLARNQRPDGTFAGATGWTLQRLLVVTAEATRAAAADQAPGAARQRALQVATRAAGAFARTAEQVSDGFTAAAILASGAVSGELADTLRKRVRDAIKTTEDGAAFLAVGEGVVRGDGTVPTRVEATALAVLALQGDAHAPLADLGTTLLGGYSIERGWGDGHANLVAMRAVLALFKDPLPASVAITLEMDGAPIVHGTLEGAKLRDVLALDGAVPAGLAGAHTWKLVAAPAVPGLGYSLAFDSWVPWDKQAVHAGLELALPAHVDAQVGKPVEITVTAIAPSGIALHIQQALPAGVQVDRPGLEARVAAGAIERFVAADGTLDLYVPALAPGKTFTLAYRLIPTLGGTLHTGASLLEAGANQFHVPPAEWTIK
jgi:alpha-2-macroglobulin family protein